MSDTNVHGQPERLHEDENRPQVLRAVGEELDPSIMIVVARTLRAGEIVAYPTDTFYGLGASPGSGAAIEKIFGAKQRRSSEPLPLIAADIDALEAAVGTLSSVARTLASAFWPGPLTLIVPRGAARLADAVIGRRDTIAVRVPAHPLARAVANAAGGLITSTSANVSGASPASNAAQVVLELGARVALVLDGGATPGGAASTIVDVTGASPILVRAGIVPFERVLESLE